MAIDTSTHTPAPRRAVFEDGFGKRHHAVGPGGEPLEVLEFKDDLTSAASFELAVRERVAAVAAFQHTSFAHVRSVQRLGPNASKLVVISDRVPGARLSTILGVARQQLLPLEVNAALCLIRQLVPAMAMLHEKMPAMAHAALSPERIIITPNARLVIADHMLGSAVEQLQYSHDRYWKELRIPLPPAAQPTFDQRADVMQTGLVALALILGRPLDGEDYPDRIGALAEGAWGLTTTGGVEPLPAELRTWLGRMLQLDSRHSFASAVEAWTELERVLGSSDYVASFGALKAFMAEYARTAASTTTTVKPAVVVPPVPAAAPPQAPAQVASATPSPIVPGQTPRPEQAPLRPAPVPVAAVPPQPVQSVPPTPRPEPLVASAPAPVPFAPVEASRPVAPAPVAPSPAARLPLPAVATVAPPSAQERWPEQSRNVPWWRQRWAAAAAVLLALASGGTYLGRYYLSAPAVAEASGTLVVTTNPAGVPVLIDNQPRGVTPLTVELAPGSHQLRLVTEGEPRVIPLTITPGGTVSQTLELPRTEPRTGQLAVRSEPSGARVTVDGSPRGNAPLTLDGLAPGNHTIVLANELGSVTHEVTVEAGATASLVVPMSAPQGAPVSGWIAVSTPTEVQIFEDERLLGTSRSDRIMVTAGRHEVDVVNEALGYRVRRMVSVSPGQVATLRLDWPKGAMAINAQPWAEVWINGDRIGETPIGNVSVPIGVHEVVFRHPQLGEQVVRATVTANAPARVSVDMRKK